MRSDDIRLAEALADAAGAAIRPLYRAEHELEMKEDSSPVTRADRAAERAMRAILARERPDDAVVGEEEGETPGTSGRTWVLDPIDGTKSFIAGRPIFGTLVALLDGGWPVLGVIDQPILRERWVGATGRATTFNGAPAATRRCAELSGAVLATTSPRLFDEGQHHAFVHVERACGPVVLGGDCYAYATLAIGQVDLVVEAGLKLYDFAALVPVVEGAGGRMCDWNGEPLTEASVGEVVALGDPARMDEVIELLGCRG